MSEYNDDLLIYYIHLNNKTAYDILYKKYKNIIEIILRSNINFNIVNFEEYNDIFEECLLLFEKVINSYRNESGTFYMYYLSTINNVLYSHLKNINNRNNKNIYECDFVDKDVSIFNYLSDSVFIDDEFSYKEERKQLLNECESMLEDKVIKLKMLGYSYREISEILDIKIKRVDYILSTIKKKIKKNNF